MKHKSIGSVGEFGLVSQILKNISRQKSHGMVVGPGDDAFAAQLSAGHLLVGTKDLLVEGIHFRRDWATAYEIGYKSITVNLSDLAAMGWCVPLYGLVGLALPPETDYEFVTGLCRGMNAACKKYGVSLAGGDTVSSQKQITISVTMLGAARKKYIITRSGAKAGDIIAVSGYLGDSGAGLHILKNGISRKLNSAAYLVRKHLLPEPRLALAKRLARSGAVTSMIDSSDGMAASVRFICESSGAGAKIDMESLPLSGQLKKYSLSDARLDPVKMALSGGEDYELVFTVRQRDFLRLKHAEKAITPVGVITAGKKITYYSHAQPQEIKTQGFQHFADARD